MRITDELAGGQPGIEAIATGLGMSRSTLQRRLADEGTTHRELLETVQRELAESYLARTELNLGEVAYLLGYSNVTAFHRAFKRWAGRSPAEFRAEMSAG